MKNYRYETCCIYCDDKVDALNKMTETGVSVTYRTMLRHCRGLLDWAQNNNYDKRSDVGLTLKNDWAVSYNKSTFEGRPCYYLVWSHIEFIWTKLED